MEYAKQVSSMMMFYLHLDCFGMTTIVDGNRIREVSKQNLAKGFLWRTSEMSPLVSCLLPCCLPAAPLLG